MLKLELINAAPLSNEHGYKVIRFQNIEIKEGLDQVLTLIAEALK